MRVFHASHDKSREIQAGTSAWLEVRRGRTRFPHRPLTSSRYLIGSGTNCHLQLGGPVPMLHSLLVLDGDCWTLDVVAPEPTLFVNGEACRHRALCVGDRIQIGDFEFALCRGDGGPPEPAPRRPHRPAITSTSLSELPTSLSASELIERMESEVVTVSEFEEGRRNGARALLEAIRQRPVILKMGDVQPQCIRKAA